MRKMVFIVAWLMEEIEAHHDVTTADLEEGLMKEVQDLPYVAQVEKVTILDVEE